jgi:hypothetical protein
MTGNTIRHSTFQAKALRLEVIRVGRENRQFYTNQQQKNSGNCEAVKPGVVFTFHSDSQLWGAWHNSVHIVLGYSRNIHTSSLPHRKFGVTLPPFGCLDAF